MNFTQHLNIFEIVYNMGLIITELT